MARRATKTDGPVCRSACARAQAPMADLLRVHDYDYIAALRRKCDQLGPDAVAFLDPPGVCVVGARVCLCGWAGKRMRGRWVRRRSATAGWYRSPRARIAPARTRAPALRLMRKPPPRDPRSLIILLFFYYKIIM